MPKNPAFKGVLLLEALCLLAACSSSDDSPKSMQQVDFSQVTICDDFWTSRLENNAGRRDVKLTLETGYPWDGGATLTFDSAYKGKVKLRIPLWCKSFTVGINGETLEGCELDRGYVVVDRKWKKGDSVTIKMDMPVEILRADPRVKADEGLRAVRRGPLVYCIEQADNDVDFEAAGIGENTVFETSYDKDLLGGVETITATTGAEVLKLIPYYSWDNRAPGEMKVWLRWEE